MKDKLNWYTIFLLHFNYSINILDYKNYKIYLSIERLNDKLELGYSVKKLKNLRLLDLTNKSIKILPKEIGELINLQQLYLFNNRMTILPNSIGGLINFQYLFFNSPILSGK